MTETISKPSDDACYALIVRAEVAAEVVNRARTLLQTRRGKASGTADGAVLDQKGRQLYAVLRSIDHREPVGVERLIARWSALLLDEDAFWDRMLDLSPIEVDQPS